MTDNVFHNVKAFRRSELAKRLGVSERTLDRWDADGVGPAGRFKIGSTVLYVADAAEAWLKARVSSINIPRGAQ